MPHLSSSQQQQQESSEHLRDNDEIELYNNEAYQHVFNAAGFDNASDNSGSGGAPADKRQEDGEETE